MAKKTIAELLDAFDLNPCFSDLLSSTQREFENAMQSTRSPGVRAKAGEALELVRSLYQYRELIATHPDAQRRKEMLTDVVNQSFRLGQLWNEVKSRRMGRRNGGRNTSALTPEQWEMAAAQYHKIRAKLKSDKDSRVRTAAWILKEFKVELTQEAIRAHV